MEVEPYVSTHVTTFVWPDVDSEAGEAIEEALVFFLAATSDICECGEPDTMVTAQRELVRAVLNELREGGES